VNLGTSRHAAHKLACQNPPKSDLRSHFEVFYRPDEGTIDDAVAASFSGALTGPIVKAHHCMESSEQIGKIFVKV
jgi:hypothetical protein